MAEKTVVEQLGFDERVIRIPSTDYDKIEKMEWHRINGFNTKDQKQLLDDLKTGKAKIVSTED
jgi:hypothetical protein